METPASAPAPQPAFREIIDDALRYWEFSRIFYNIILVAIVVTHLYRQGIPVEPSQHGFFVLFLQAVMANVCYTAAYVVDIPVQYSSYRKAWRKWRWLLWYTGTVFAGILAYFSVLDGV